jgi:hypothetical protein
VLSLLLDLVLIYLPSTGTSFDTHFYIDLFVIPMTPQHYRIFDFDRMVVIDPLSRVESNHHSSSATGTALHRGVCRQILFLGGAAHNVDSTYIKAFLGIYIYILRSISVHLGD